MREFGLCGADGRRGGPRTTSRDPKRASAPDLVDRSFARAEPDRLWVCDLKYVQTGQGFVFLACAQDVFSRHIVGWSMRDDLQAELVLDALGMTVAARQPNDRLVAHSDHGNQYTSLVYGAYAKQSAIDLSMGSIGDPGITRSPKRSSPASRKNSYAANASPPESTPGCGSSGTSSAATTPAATRPLACSHQPNTKTDTSTPKTPPDSRIQTPENRGQIKASPKPGQLQLRLSATAMPG